MTLASPGVASSQSNSQTDSQVSVIGNSAKIAGDSREQVRWQWMLLALQLLLVVWIVELFEIEQRRSLITMLAISVSGFPIYFRLPVHYRAWFFVGLTVLTAILILGWQPAAVMLGVGGLLVGMCYLPLHFYARIGLLLVAGGLLAMFRSGSSDILWPVLGSMFMFRLVLFVAEHRRHTDLPPLRETLPYFFLIPNVCFVLFPVVDFATYQQTRQQTMNVTDCQRAINWIVLGITHLLIYRAIRYWILPPPGSIENVNSLLLFLATNYGLYLRVAGQFHLSIGILHLYGFRLPPTHAWFFFASSLTDIWRRINIYWKDFMSKLFFMPAFFWLRRSVGDGWGVVFAVLWVFVGTWLAHSWQVFWLLGEFPMSRLDAQLWLGAGLFVSLNALLDYRSVRQSKPNPANYSWSSAAWEVLRIMGTFLLVSFFWTRWTNPDLLATLQRDFGWKYFMDLQQWLLLALVLTCVWLLGLALHFRLFQLSRLPQVSTPQTLVQRSGFNVAWLAGLLLLAQPVLLQYVPMQWTHVLLGIKSDHFSQTEGSQLVQGYYEQLNEGSIQAGLFSGHGAATQEDEQRRNFMDFTRSRRDILQLELIPNFKAEYSGSLISINRWGMRNRDIEKMKPLGTVRIALIGTSIVMGYGVGDEQTFASLLETRLNADRSLADAGVKYEVLNFGVGKYTAIQRRALLEQKVFGFSPDVVMYFAHQDELSGPVFDLAKLAHTGLIDDPCLYHVLQRAKVDHKTPLGVIRNRMPNYAVDILRCSYERVVADCQRHGIAPIWVDLPMPGDFEIPGSPEMARAVAGEAGFHLLDLTRWAEGYQAADIKLHVDAHHANARGHQLIAQKLMEALESNPGWLSQ